MVSITMNKTALNLQSQQQIVSRIQRYRDFIENEFIQGLYRYDEYSLEALKEELKQKIQSKQFNKIVFTGMGCSAIVSDLIKGFFISENIPVEVDVINDYDLDYLISKSTLKSDSTLVIISSYSGYSQEPIHAYNAIKQFTNNIIFLTSGGNLEMIGREENVSIIHWRLKNPDREYPLFHVPQYFSILLDVFYRLGVLNSNYQDKLAETARFLKQEFSEEKIAQAVEVAKQLRDCEIVLLATPKWYQTLLKIVKMHFNEIAMAPAHSNHFHEFCHSEVAIHNDPISKQAIILFKDEEDDYTEQKMRNLQKLLSTDIRENQKISFVQIEMNHDNFFQQLFSTLLFVHHVTYELGKYYNVKSRDLISQAAQNQWYSIDTIRQEQREGKQMVGIYD